MTPSGQRKGWMAMQSINEAVSAALKARDNNQAYQQLVDHVLNDPEVHQFLAQNANSLTVETIERGYSKLYEFYRERELMRAGRATVAPGYAPHLELANGQIAVTYVPTAQLNAQREQEARLNRVQAINMPKFIRQASFDTFYMEPERTSPSRQQAFMAVTDFMNRYLANQGFVPGLYFSGSFGVGKTFLLGALANELAGRGVESTLVHFPTFAVQMKGAIANNTLDQKRDRVKAAPILMLDDIGADALSTWLRDDILGVILEYRMQEELPTFFSSNFTMAELEAHLAVDTQGNQEPLKAKRIMERIRFLAREVPVSGRNLRQEQRA